MSGATALQASLDTEDAQNYRETLKELTFNSRPHIVTLTELARDYGRSIPQAIVHLIEARITKAPDAAKLPTLYLMDSIIKNHADPYKPLFGRNLPGIFAHVFSRGRETVRASMWKLRNTWTPLYSRDVLYALDVKVNKIDPAWPLSEKPKEGGSRIHVNPNFFDKARTSSGTANANESSKDDELRKLEEANKALKRKLLEMENQKLQEQIKSKSNDSSSSLSSSPGKPKEAASKKSTSKDSNQKVSSGSSSKKDDKKARTDLPPELAKILDPKSEASKNRAKSRSPTRQSPTSTSTEKSSTPPPPPSIREDFNNKSGKSHRSRSSRKDKKSLEESNKKSDKPFRIPKKSKRSPSPVSPSSQGSNRTPPKKAKKDEEFQRAENNRSGFQRGGRRQQNPTSAPPPMPPQNPWQSNFRMPTNNPMFGQHQLNNQTDPEVILSQIVPMLIGQNQREIQQGAIHPEQFSNNMKHISELREWAMIQKAERLENKENSSSRPWGQMFQNLMPSAVASSTGVSRDLPMARAEDLDLVASDPVKSIEIDNVPRMIRFYGDQGTILMTDKDNQNVIYDLKFRVLEGDLPVRKVVIDNDMELAVPVSSPEYTKFMLDGNQEHSIKIGAPTRELWIDGLGYSCYFDNSINVQIGNKVRTVYLGGPAPHVDIGTVARKDLCAGTVQLLIDGDVHNSHLMFLDEKLQRIDIDGKPHIFQFVDQFKTLLINGHPFKAEFGRQPMVVHVNQVKHYLRLTALPKGVKEGQPWPTRDEVFKDVIDNSEDSNAKSKFSPEPDEDSNAEGTHLDRFMNSGVMSSPAVSKPEKDYEKQSSTNENEETPKDNPVDVSKLLASLMGAGLIKKSGNVIPGLDTPVQDKKAAQEAAPIEKMITEEPKVVPEEPVKKKIDWSATSTLKQIRSVILKSHHSSIKERQEAIVDRIFDPKALQCKNCGVRYSPNDQVSYSKHLDWHFRMKKRNKENAKRAQSRKWYLELSNWIISNEIDDNTEESNNEEKTANDAESEVQPSVPATGDPEMDKCPVCFEDFETFFKEDNDLDIEQDGGQWHLRNAIQPPGEANFYHPQCYGDKSNIYQEEEEPEEEEEAETEKVEVEQPVAEPMEHESATETVQIKVENSDEQPMETEDQEASNGATSTEAEKAEVKTEPETSQLPTLKIEPPSEDLDKSVENLTGDVGVTAPPTFNVSNGIKINISSQASAPASPSKEETAGNESISQEIKTEDVAKEEESEFDVDCIIQEKSKQDEEDPFRHKPRLRGRKLTELPMIEKDSDLSGLCSIM